MSVPSTATAPWVDPMGGVDRNHGAAGDHEATRAAARAAVENDSVQHQSADDEQTRHTFIKRDYICVDVRPHRRPSSRAGRPVRAPRQRDRPEEFRRSRDVSACCSSPRRCGTSHRGRHRADTARAGARPSAGARRRRGAGPRAGPRNAGGRARRSCPGRGWATSGCSATKQPLASRYYAKLPGNLFGAYMMLVDPMLATGGSAVAALDP